ncbi:RTA-like protein [Kalmanozyma brasiliensis GHG001]|uniref:RTA1-domain-containing protein n=1 Tax=Kalmanozyma brasiliensis (strain GHG001) TaxID=1365824 RepID=V5EJ74_KALBG|nr:RTA-like protein [Kalmanozyma brasiliensis GHG001]EST04780.1 RTA-like protein [Kalmanozyma brasiliensis GHG001]
MDTYDCTGVDPMPDSLCSIENSSYGFRPALWTGILFSTLFGLVMLIHAFLLLFHRAFPRFMFIAIVAAAGELAGWIARTFGHTNPFNRNAYIAQIVCLILSPAFISAVNYVAFQNVMDVFGSRWSRIPRKWYVIGFCFGDLCSLVVQAVGGAMSAEATTEDQVETGKNIMIAGVSVQVAVTAPFMLLYLDYNIRRLREWARLAKDERPHRRVEIFNKVIGVSTLLILVRCIYRIVEMADGWVGYLATTEVYFDVLDGLMILLAIGVFIPFHPGWFLPRNKEKGVVYNAAESEELEKPRLQTSASEDSSADSVATPTPFSPSSSHSGHSPA